MSTGHDNHAKSSSEVAKAQPDTPVGSEKSDGFSVLIESGRQSAASPFWPIGLCIGWVATRDTEAAVRSYAEHRSGDAAVAPLSAWVQAETTVIEALMKGEIEAFGFKGRNTHASRTKISSPIWKDLALRRRGLFDEIFRRDGTLAYRDAQIAAAQVLKSWPEMSKSRRTAAKKKFDEAACLAKLVEMMRAAPDRPTARAMLISQFPKVSRRAFDKIFQEAVRTSQAVAWSAGGRRPRTK